MDIAGKAALVTGGASGLGAATARVLANAGARVAILDADAPLGRSLAETIGGLFVHTDITSDSAIEAAIDKAQDAHGTARILVNCAGIAPALKAVSRDGHALATDAYRQVVEVNLIGTFAVLARFAARAMNVAPGEEERGVIVNTASIAASDGQIGHGAYAASKAGIVGMTLPLAREFARSRIRVMTIAPGLFETPILAGIAEAAAAAARHAQWPDRMGTPDEFAALVEHIVRNRMLNGECIRIDGAVRLPAR